MTRWQSQAAFGSVPGCMPCLTNVPLTQLCKLSPVNICRLKYGKWKQNYLNFSKEIEPTEILIANEI